MPLPSGDLLSWQEVSGFIACGVAICMGLRVVVPALLQHDSRWLRLEPSKKFTLTMMSLSSVHALAVSAFSLYKLTSGPRSDISYTQEVGCMSLGYFIHDFWMIRKQWREDVAGVLHHLLAITLIGGALCVPQGPRHICSFLVTESSTVLLNFMMACKQLDATESVAFKVGGACFALLFLCCRVLWLPYNLLYVIIRLYPTDWYEAPFVVQGVVIGLILLNFWWFYLILVEIKKGIDGMVAGSGAPKPIKTIPPVEEASLEEVVTLLRPSTPQDRSSLQLQARCGTASPKRASPDSARSFRPPGGDL